jgi:hypothetical protein
VPEKQYTNLYHDSLLILAGFVPCSILTSKPVYLEENIYVILYQPYQHQQVLVSGHHSFFSFTKQTGNIRH